MVLPQTLSLQIVTPDRSVVQEVVDEVQIPGSDGYFGVLPGHTPVLTALQVGELWYRQGQERFHVAVALGFVEVLPERVTVLADVAERAEEIDVERAETARDKMEAALSKPSPDTDQARVRLELAKALIRLQVSTRARARA